jgi:hypothetical protein
MNQELYKKALIPVYSNNNLVIYPPDENGIMFADWLGFLTVNSIKENCLAFLDCVENYPSSKILNNNLKLTGHHVGAFDWVGKEWLFNLYNKGTFAFAWVYSLEIFSQITTDQIINLNSHVKIQTFYSVENAYQWLQDQ